jgi:MinD-like ATPase involved in chromosome partitioning or flagellar assembly
VICVLVVASGAAWESPALNLLTKTGEVVVLKRCVDVDDLLATASAGQADVAVVALDAPGLDATAVDVLNRHRVRTVAVAGRDGSGAADAARARAARWGVSALVGEGELDRLVLAVTTLEEPPPDPDPEGVPVVEEPAMPGGRIVTVWGPSGAPGRTTVAVTVAAELARRGRRALLVDADPYGGAVAQQLGVLDEVSGLLAAARLAATGGLADRFATVQRSLGARLTVITGLPRPDRWVEVKAGAIELILETGRDRGHVVVDTGFGLEPDPAPDFGSRPARNSLTIGSLQVADEIVVVGGADPVALSRLARGLVEVREVVGSTPLHVVVNRHRATLGWSTAEVTGMVEGFADVAGVHFLPDDRAAVDRALVAGRTLVECGDSPVLRAVSGVVDAVVPSSVDPPTGGRGLRRRTAGRARRP